LKLNKSETYFTSKFWDYQICLQKGRKFWIFTKFRWLIFSSGNHSVNFMNSRKYKSINFWKFEPLTTERYTLCLMHQTQKGTMQKNTSATKSWVAPIRLLGWSDVKNCFVSLMIAYSPPSTQTRFLSLVHETYYSQCYEMDAEKSLLINRYAITWGILAFKKLILHSFLALHLWNCLVSKSHTMTRHLSAIELCRMQGRCDSAIALL